MSHIPYYGEEEKDATSEKNHTHRKELKTMTNKNGFEIRAEVLEMAKSYMDRQMEMNIEYANKMQDLGGISREDFKNAYKPYGIETLMEKAQEFYGFVEKK
jgi:hypothetical protein